MKIILHAKNINDSTRLDVFTESTNIDLETTLYLCRDRICEQCGNDHDFSPSFENVKTNIDTIPEPLAHEKGADRRSLANHRSVLEIHLDDRICSESNDFPIDANVIKEIAPRVEDIAFTLQKQDDEYRDRSITTYSRYFGASEVRYGG